MVSPGIITSMNAPAPNKRRDKDVTKMMISGYHVELINENYFNEIVVDFPGPVDSPYFGVSAPFVISAYNLKVRKTSSRDFFFATNISFILICYLFA